ncbi:MetQ/NlpA family ABC transporter substrate-binding protein [Paracoccus salipaludis]|uniref:Metal ABC transporter substrate-binding protein n=1 Tax=Paracoccus salipaludis TaxID=2032623 RepID=A0A2A2GP56_9RHOB|nr:MetQ/NlpA family ABC transporter substrate-binding protein [Paracoccus salipaludis]PAU98807.1 metal ABC transporter substrate-binding protein [Paracoccus salipaludis]
MLRLIAAALALSAGMAAAEDIKVGVTPGEHAEIMEQIVPLAAAKGLNIDVIEFSDYVVPNTALADGDLNANSFQHVPYLENQIKDRGFEIVAVAKTITTPMGVYSNKVKSLDELADDATVAIPNDPTNGGRALLVLADEGVITVSPDAGLVPTPLDITENPKNFKFRELDAAQLPRALEDADAAVINTNFALAAGISPREDSIAMEKADSPYANVIAVRKGDEEQPWLKTLVEVYHSPEIKNYIETKYEGAVIPAW